MPVSSTEPRGGVVISRLVKLKYFAASLFLLVVGCDGDDGPNQAPAGVADEATTAEDTSITIDVLGNDSDPDGDELRVSLPRPLLPEVGVARIDGDSLVVEPAPNYSGDIELEYRISDRRLTADVPVVVHVTPVNDRPEAIAREVQTGRNEPV